ncbi:hypothetical protein [Nocardia sp. NPDC052566]|uniref:hypothetical protein n=1 Tax=Nocardia sp. NPDC052566 TaxID=3364330 RepID=UPI0037CAF590
MQKIPAKLRLLVVGFVVAVAAIAVATLGAGAANANSSWSGSVNSGYVNPYVINASAGQTLTTDLTSSQGEARFTIVSPTGVVLCKDAKWSRIKLPQVSGGYTINVYTHSPVARYTLTANLS